MEEVSVVQLQNSEISDIAMSIMVRGSGVEELRTTWKGATGPDSAFAGLMVACVTCLT